MNTCERRIAIVQETRSWLGTPYVHQACRKGTGTDCLGLIRGVWRACVAREPSAVPNYTMDWGERDEQERLWDAANYHLIPVAAESGWEIGQVLLFRMRRGAVAKHLGILSEHGLTPKFVHAYSGRAVCENTLSHPWARRIVARFEFPGLGD